MGELRYFKPAYATSGAMQIGKSVPWKDTNGTSRSSYVGATVYNYPIMPPTNTTYYTFEASEETLAEYNMDAYQNSKKINDVSITSSYTQDGASGQIVFNLNITASANVTINSIFYIKTFDYSSSSRTKGLSWAYYFDSPLDIASGETKKLTMIVDFID